MHYPLNRKNKLKANKLIKQLQKQIELWVKEKEKAIIDRENSPNKYYANITQRIKDIKSEINKREKSIKEIREAKSKGYIEI